MEAERLLRNREAEASHREQQLLEGRQQFFYGEKTCFFGFEFELHRLFSLSKVEEPENNVRKLKNKTFKREKMKLNLVDIPREASHKARKHCRRLFARVIFSKAKFLWSCSYRTLFLLSYLELIGVLA